MTKAKNKPLETYELVAVKINAFDIDIGSSLNHEVKDLRYAPKDTKLLSFNSKVAMEGVVTYPEERIGQQYKMEVHGGDWYYQKYDLTLDDCRVCDEHGVTQYRKHKGRIDPVYDVPKGIGHLERIRGANTWIGWLWVPPNVITHILSVLPLERPKYLSIHEHIVGRHRFINRLGVQAVDPATE
jgi:hypothetical protein